METAVISDCPETEGHYLPYLLLQLVLLSLALPFSSYCHLPSQHELQSETSSNEAHLKVLATPTSLAMGLFEGINFYIAEKLVKDASQV